ncbi:S-layer family protein [Limnohabitans sp. JirII-31]|uniref:beta strand repeat-containing protein n=1 Tax=Limnohabitans sp. JirII-31 TaxID=1977908 RepID=UPI0013044B74|nr:cadherin-like domain-containing protein [Limnohabitans sp. JirII-31]
MVIIAKRPASIAGDAIDATLPDGTSVVSTSTTANGQTTVTAKLLDKDGHVLLSAGPGQTMERDPETGIVQVRTGTSDQVQQYDPATGEVSNALRTGSDAAQVFENLLDVFSNPKLPTDKGVQVADANGTLPDTPAPTNANTNTFTHYLDTQANTLTTAQQDALAAQMDKLGLGNDKSLSFYTLPGGGALIATADGDIVGEIVHSSSGDLNLKATAIDASGNTVEVNQHINEQGSVLTQDQYNTQAQQQASALFNSLMAANNWDHLSDVGKLSALVNLYNATDKLGEAFGATGNNLPGDLGAAAGWLSLAQGLQSGDSLIIANGINVVSDRALDNAMNEAFGNTAAGESVPYLSYALAIRNFEDNPEVAAGTMLGTYIGEDIGAVMGGPIGAAIGGAIGGFIGGALGGLWGDDDPPPPPLGLVHFGWNANGEIIPLVDIDQSGGANAAISVANQLLDGLNQIVTQRNQAIDEALFAQGVDPAVFTSFHVSVNASTLPSVQWDQKNGALTGYTDSFSWASATRFLSFAEGHFCIQPKWAVDIEKFQSITKHADVGIDDVTNVARDLSVEISGTAQITLDSAGNATAQNRNNGLGGQIAKMYAQEILSQAQIQVDLLNDRIDRKLNLDGVPELQWDQYHVALNPAKLPEIKFDGDRAYFLSYSDEGTEKLQAINLNGFGEQLHDKLSQDGCIQTSWEYETIREHWINTQSDIHEQQLQGADTTVLEANALIQLRSSAVYGDASQSADFKSQTYGALLVHARGEVASTIELLRDVDGDGYLEKTQLFSAKDFSGNLQALLVLDFNGNGLIETRDILNLGGNTSEGNPTDAARLANANADLQRNNIEWLDANGDGTIDKSDPAFAAIKLWVDVNQDGVQSGNEVSSLASQHISSINFKTGEVTYADGHTDALTAQTLKADTEGIKFTQIREVNPDGTLRTLDAGTVLEHEGYQGQVQITDEGGTRWVDKREQTYEQQALRTGDWEGTAEQEAHRQGGGNVEGAPTQTTATGATNFGPVKAAANQTTQSTVAAGDARVVSDAPTQATVKPNAQVTFVAGDSRIKSDAVPTPSPAANSIRVPETRLAFVPSTQASSTNEIRLVTQDMIESAGSSMFGAAGLGVLGAVGLGATASAAEAAAVQANVVSAGSNTNPSSNSANAVSTNNQFTTTLPTSGASSNTSLAPSTPAEVVVKQAEVFSAPVLVVQGVQTVQTAATSSSTSSPAFVSSTPASPVTEAAPVVVVKAVVISSATSSKASSDSTSATSSATATSTDATSTTSSVSASAATYVTLDYPVVSGETLPGTEDVVLRLSQDVLLANDSSPNASADPNAPALTITAVADAVNGQVSLNDGVVVFMPNTNFHGEASFTYTVTDQYGLSTTGSTTLVIAAVNDAPVTQGETGQTQEDTAIYFNVADLLSNDSDVDSVTDGQVLSITGIAAAQNGTATLLADGRIRFVPDSNFHGSAQFTYIVNDGNDASNNGSTTATVNVDVSAVNDAPVTQQDTDSVDEDIPIFFTQAQLLKNDSDVDTATDGQVLSITAVTGASNGTVSMLANGDISFIPNANYHGAASFTYTVSDGNGGTTNASVSITVNEVNDTPVVQGESTSTNEDTTLYIAASKLLDNDSDVDTITDGQVLSLSAVSSISGKTHGTVSLVNNADGTQTVQFAPDANYHGVASFNYTVSDGNGGYATAVATINLAAVNDAPVTVGETSSTDEDVWLTFTQAKLLENDSDVDTATDGQVLTITAVSGATNGKVSMLANGDIRFTPDANYHGTASFTYTVSDGNGATTDASVNLTVLAVNDSPKALGDVFVTQEDSAIVLTSKQLLANDTDNDIATDADVLTISRVFDALHCTVTLNTDGTINLVPDAQYHGNVRFSYEITDVSGATSTAFVVAGVSAVNDAPVSQSDSFDGTEDTLIILEQADVLANDTDNDVLTDADSLSVQSVGNASHGTVRLLSSGQIEFLPDANYHGLATFDYVVTDTFGATSTNTVTLSIGAVNDTPVVQGESTNTNEDTTLNIAASKLLANDSDVDTITDGQVLSLSGVSSISGKTHGTVALVSNADGTQTVQYTPDANYHGTASFNYTVSDGNGGYATSTATVTVSAVNDAPVTADETDQIDEDNAITWTQAELLANDSDVDTATDGQVLSITAVSDATHGTVSMLASGDIQFIPTANYHGTASFTYTVSDGNGATTDAGVSITVNAVNDTPVVLGETVSTSEDITLNIAASTLLSNDSDVDTATDGQVLNLSSVSSISGKTHGTVSLVTNADGTQTVQYTPDANYHGTASFNYTVSDGNGGYATSTATVTVSAVNDAPVTADETDQIDEDNAITWTQAELLANDSDVDTATDGQVLSITAVSGATNGTVSMLASGDIQFIPNANYHGTASFTYTVSDGNGGTTNASVSITVNEVNDTPGVLGETVSTSEDTTLNIAASKLLANDSDVDTITDGQVLSLSAVGSINGKTHGTVTLVSNADGTQTVQYTPDANYHGTASFNYTVSDGNGGYATAVATVTVAAVNDAPVTMGETSSTDEDTAIVFTQADLLANDSDVDTATDGQVLSITAVSGATNGTVSMLASGDIQFIPNANYHGTASFTYTVSDGNGATTDASVSITVNAVNDTPVVLGETVSTSEDTTLNIAVSTLLSNDSDVDTATDGQVLTLSSVSTISGKTHGTVALVNNADGTQTVQYTPDANYHGTASFNYTVSDGNGGYATAVATVTVAAVNDAPVTVGETSSTDEDTGLTFTQAQLLNNDSDVDTATDGQVLTITAVSGATNGTVSMLANGDIRFIPNANYHGAASFTYTVSDSNGGTTDASVSITVNAVNDIPVVLGESTSTNEDTTLYIAASKLLANDSDVDTITDGQVLSLSSVSSISGQTHGAVSLINNADGTQTVQFTPDANYHGVASFN